MYSSQSWLEWQKVLFLQCRIEWNIMSFSGSNVEPWSDLNSLSPVNVQGRDVLASDARSRSAAVQGLDVNAGAATSQASAAAVSPRRRQRLTPGGRVAAGCPARRCRRWRDDPTSAHERRLSCGDTRGARIGHHAAGVGFCWLSCHHWVTIGMKWATIEQHALVCSVAIYCPCIFPGLAGQPGPAPVM